MLLMFILVKYLLMTGRSLLVRVFCLCLLVTGSMDMDLLSSRGVRLILNLFIGILNHDSRDWSTLVHCTNGPHPCLLKFRRRNGGAGDVAPLGETLRGSCSRCQPSFRMARLLMGWRIITQPIMGVNIRLTKRGERLVNYLNV